MTSRSKEERAGGEVNSSPSPSKSNRLKSTVGRVIQILLAAAGITLFVLLVKGVDFSSIPDSTSRSLPLLLVTMLGLLLANYLFDTSSWWLVAGKERPSLWRLISIRLRCESITNIVPGGAVIGEPMKVGYLMTESGMSRPAATTSFLLSKFVLIIGQTGYIFVGLLLSFGPINRVSESAFGISGFAWIVLGVVTAIFLFIVSLAAAMVLFQPMNKRLNFSTREGLLGRWWNVGLKELRQIETMVASEFRRHRFRLLIAVCFSFIAWSLNGVELFFISEWLGLGLSFSQVYAIDAVSVVVRMVIFVIPIGMGGQDWTIAGLATAHQLPDPTVNSAMMVLFKRGREFCVIGLGLLLLLVMPGRKEKILDKPGILD